MAKTQCYRAWVNQPSTLQPAHEYNQLVGICEDNGDDFVRLHFTEGIIHSIRLHRQCISRIKLSSAEDV